MNEEKLSPVDEAIALITQGDTLIKLVPEHKNVILVIGNTGSGKTTLTSFLTDPSILEAYRTPSAILIKNVGSEASKSGIVSDTMFPTLMVSKSNKSAYYDLPGFNDTRSGSIEIANAWFMKKVAGHASNIKILFVVNYQSLIGGFYRNDFMEALQYAAQLLKNPSKFSDSMALVASKADPSRTSKEIIDDIRDFLGECKHSLDDQRIKFKLNDSVTRAAVKTILDALMVKDRMWRGSPARIACFKQPQNIGLLSSMPDIMKQKVDIEQLLMKNIGFTPTHPDDFGYSVSPDAKLLIEHIVEKVHEDIGTNIKHIAVKMKESYEIWIINSPWEFLGDLMHEFSLLTSVAISLAQAPERQTFLKSLREIIYKLDLAYSLKAVLNTIEQKYTHITFLEQTSGKLFPKAFRNWSAIFEKFVSPLQGAIIAKTTGFDEVMQRELTEIVAKLLNSILKRRDYIQNSKERHSALANISDQINLVVANLAECKTVNSFVRQFQSLIRSVDDTISTSSLVSLIVDVEFRNSFGLILLSWVRPCEKLLSSLREMVFAARVDILEDLKERDAVKYEVEMKKIRAEFEAKAKVAEARLVKMKADSDDQIKAFNENLEKERAEMKAKMESMQSVIQKNEKTIRELTSQKQKCFTL